MHEPRVAGLIDRNLGERGGHEMAGECRIHGVNPAIAQAPAEFPVQLVKRSLAAQERAQPCGFGAGRCRALLEFPRDDGQGIGRHAPMECSAPGQLGKGVFLDAVTSSAAEGWSIMAG